MRGVFVAAQVAAQRMEDGGRIIAIGSCFADRVPIPGIALYAMSKAALGGLARGLARDLGPRGITANVVHPGPTDTDMNPADSPEAAPQRRHGGRPLRRGGRDRRDRRPLAAPAAAGSPAPSSRSTAG